MIIQNSKFPPSLKLRRASKIQNLCLLLIVLLVIPHIVYSQSVETELLNLQNQLKAKRVEIDELQKKGDEYRKLINQRRKEALTLQNQIAILNNQISKTNLEINKKHKEIESLNLEVKSLGIQISEKESKIVDIKDQIGELVRKIYQNDQKSYLEIFLLNETLADFFDEARYIESLQGDLQNKLMDLKETKQDFQATQLVLETKKDEKEIVKGKLEDQKVELQTQQTAKNVLLSETRQNEREFQKLLSELQAEQETINADIVSVEKRLRVKLQQRSREEGLGYLVGEKLAWPVPKNTITAYFHDPDYPFRRIFEHPAIDIRTGQGTEVRAAASGYVVRTKRDIGCRANYSYIMIIHPNGLATVYGHLSAIDVQEDQFITQGQRIGASGGIPGTCGSGRLTTGPHLHLEVRLNGIPVNPFDYLP